jgi:hypothetical protein
MSRLSASFAGVLLLLTGCTSTPVVSARPHLDVQVLGFSGCPNTPELLSRVKHAAVVAGFSEQIVYVDLARLPETDSLRAWPAPTVLVDGRDLLGMAKPAGSALGCRIYADGLPSVDFIANRFTQPHASH